MHNRDDSPGEGFRNPGARFLKTVKGMILVGRESCAETVGGIIPKEMPSVANDWVKSRSLRAFESTRLNVQSSLTQVRVTPSTRVSHV